MPPRSAPTDETALASRVRVTDSFKENVEPWTARLQCHVTHVRKIGFVPSRSSKAKHKSQTASRAHVRDQNLQIHPGQQSRTCVPSVLATDVWTRYTHVRVRCPRETRHRD